MRIGLLITSIANFGEKGFYNSQEIGFAKALAKTYDKVIIYRAVSGIKDPQFSRMDDTNISVVSLPSINFGINGLIKTSHLDKTIDAMIYFSDTQLLLTKVYKWCRTNSVKLMPYIGVIESHSENKIIKKLINSLFLRNLAIYKKTSCLVKTPAVKENLLKRGVNNITIAPVGLDLSVVNTSFRKTDIENLKATHGYEKKDKILLFIGRLVEEKQPIKMVEIFEKLYKADNDYRLIFIGSGHLKNDVLTSIKEKNIKQSVNFIEKIPNSDIWEFYRISDAFINLNQQEIFGMAILEAMYYDCKVVAWKAPGPSFIIEDNISGYLVDNVEAIITCIEKSSNVDDDAHKRIIEQFTWNKTAEIIVGLI